MNREWLTLSFGVALVLLVVVFTILKREGPAENASPPPTAEVEAPAPAADPPPEAERADAGPAAPATAPAAERRARPAPAPPEPEAPAPEPPPAGAVLRVESDVRGASVFLDREYVGTTPLTLRGVEPGQKQLNVSATGYDGYAESIAIINGTNTVRVEFRKVRLNASIPVVHRHGMGSCDGTLSASVDGLRYETTNESDAFRLPFSSLEEFAVDYLKKNLRVKLRGGRTWNFTDTTSSSDALFAFHRDVERARARMAER